MDPITWAVVFVASFLISYAIAKRQPKQDGPKPSDLASPVVKEGAIIEFVFGDVLINEPKIIWYGNVRTSPITERVKTGLFSKKTITKGYRYYVSMHIICSHGPVDAITEFRVDDKIAWSGSVIHNSDISIDAYNLFGGEDGEGGIRGTLRTMFGNPYQDRDTTLASLVDENIPAYRGFFGLFWDGIIAVGNPYLKPISFRLKRILKGWHNDNCWYPEKAEIGNNMNAIHIIYQCLTDPRLNVNASADEIDDANFKACADILYAEGMGISIKYSSDQSVGEFIDSILAHIGAMRRRDRQTGKHQIVLLRHNYDVDGLFVFNKSNFKTESFERAAFGETPNEVTVVYQQDFKDASVTVNDTALIDIERGKITRTNNYPGFNDRNTAIEVAQRDHAAVTTPVSRATGTASTDALLEINKGDVVRYVYEPEGVDGPYRILEIEIGDIKSNSIRIVMSEDIFGLEQNNWIGVADSNWTDPINDPADSPSVIVTEMPYYDLARALTAADLDYLTADDCRVQVIAQESSIDALSYELYSSAGSDALVDRAEMPFTPHCVLSADITQEIESTLHVTSLNRYLLDAVEVGQYIMIGSELMRLESYNTSTNQIIVKRGVLDTVPAEHATGDAVWFSESSFGFDGIDYQSGQTVHVKCQTKTSKGILDIGDATQHNYAVNQRQIRPYPPAGLKLNDEYFPKYISGELEVSWLHRNRKTQTSSILSFTDSSVTPETGTTYHLEIYDESDSLAHTESSLSGDNFTYSKATEELENGLSRFNRLLRIKLKSKRDGFDSWQTHDVTFYRAGYGLNYGKYYGGGV